jgi:hypothetical protein
MHKPRVHLDHSSYDSYLGHYRVKLASQDKAEVFVRNKGTGSFETLTKLPRQRAFENRSSKMNEFPCIYDRRAGEATRGKFDGTESRDDHFDHDKQSSFLYFNRRHQALKIPFRYDDLLHPRSAMPPRLQVRNHWTWSLIMPDSGPCSSPGHPGENIQSRLWAQFEWHYSELP